MTSKNSKVRLSLPGARQLEKGDIGYSPTSRRYKLDSGETISRREFAKRAERVETPRLTPPRPQQENKTRKTRADKGMTREDYRLVKQYRKDNKPGGGSKRSIRPLTKETARQRFELAENIYRHKHGLLPGEQIRDPAFYEHYDKIKHPSKHSAKARKEARSILYDYADWQEDWGDYNYPDGETP